MLASERPLRSAAALRAHYLIVDDFLPIEVARAMREDIDAHFCKPNLHSPATHQIWNYWFVPDLYTYLRTLPEKVIKPSRLRQFMSALEVWSAATLGMKSVGHPYLSLYVSGCRQNLHNDARNGRFAFVYSLTRDDRKSFGGQTIVLNEGDLFREKLTTPAAGQNFYTEIEPRFNRLVVFDDRIPHGVERVEGPMDPVEGRFVLHGHINEAGPIVEGALTANTVTQIIAGAISPLFARPPIDIDRYHGPLVARFIVGKSGEVEACDIIVDRVIGPGASDDWEHFLEMLVSIFKTLKFPPAEGNTLVIEPIMFGQPIKYIGPKDKTLPSVDKAVALKPEYAEAHNKQAVTLRERRRLEEALASADRAIALKPDYADAYNNRGVLLHDLKRPGDAVIAYDKAITLKPDFAFAYNNRGNALQDLKRFEEALASYDKAILLKPDYASSYNNRGNALKSLGRYDDAVMSYNKAIALDPDLVLAYNNRSIVFRELDRLDEAIASSDQAIARAPTYSEAYVNRGNAYKDAGRLDEAVADYDRAVALKPDLAPAHWNKSLCLLRMGRFEEGWKSYEWRKKLEQPLGNRTFVKPLWLGKEDVSGKSVFLHFEQGFGDALQFSRYGRLVKALGAKVYMSVPTRLYSLMKQLEPEIRVVDQNEVPRAFDFHCPLMSLPLAFKTRLDTIPAQDPPLAADKRLVEEWRGRLPPPDRPRIGLVWSGSENHTNDRNRSMNLSDLRPLFAIDAHWISLQKELRAGESLSSDDFAVIRHYGEEQRDFSDTAAMIHALDLVITVDTSVAHLAGAMGKPVWILLAYNADWRWLLDRTDSPWYPSARLFRQDSGRNRNRVITNVQKQLEVFCQACRC